MNSERTRMADRRAVVGRDIEELAEQVAVGEIDEETSKGLLETYRKELETLDLAMASLPTEVDQAEEPEAPAVAQTSVRKVVVAGVALIVVLTGAIAFAARRVPGGEPVAASPGDLTVDPASVSSEELEAVVAANPDISAMRMALADRYFGEENYGAALDHYLYIAGNSPTDSEESKALARVGWIAYTSGLAEPAEQYVLESLSIDPANPEARLFLGFITFYGLDDAEAAIPQLEAALALPDLPDELVTAVESALAEARAAP